MASTRRQHLQVDPNLAMSDAGRELFEACRNGDLNKVKKLVSTHNVNAKDTAGRKSSPLHFAAGELWLPNKNTEKNQAKMFFVASKLNGRSNI